jgi:hypothetical protein
VTCIAVSGNVAEVGGLMVESPDPSAVGGLFEMFFRDSGRPGDMVSRDGVSPIFADGPPATPTCNDVSSDAFGSGFFPLTNGDIAIQNLINQHG